MRFPTPLATRPTVISTTGATRPKTAISPVTKALEPSLISLNFFNIPVTNSTTGVMSFKNCSPNGAIATVISSMAFWNLNAGESSTFFNSRSASTANSSAVR